ncbi:hypothetical protein [Pseudodesulfovibrio sp.]|uniref:hypothetical protein n=1 Tax=unclassified Pseudodesulfovibrio TaxID=2661612 RepID=UPI003AFFB550
MSKAGRIGFHVVSSSGNGGYLVEFEMKDGLSVICDCPAGIHGQLCKHKLALIDGDGSVYDPEMEDGGFPLDKWAKAMKWIKESGVDELVTDFRERLKKLEAEKKRLQKQVRNEKARLARMLGEGVSA